MRPLAGPIAFALVLFAAVAPSRAADPIAIERIRHASGEDYTRIVIDLSRRTTFSWGQLPAKPDEGLPARVYVDLAGVRLDERRDLGVRFGDGRVRLLRTGQYGDDTARIVVELELEAKAEVSSMAEPARIVIDLSGPVKTVVAGKTPALETAAPTPKVDAGERLRVMIDPGHGGRDPGARGYGGLTEKETVMDVARRLAAKIRVGVPADVHLTRERDNYASLGERKDRANGDKADLFVSIHANASDNRRLRGIETFYLQNSDNRATLRLASLENGVDMLLRDGDASADADLPYIISDLAQGHKEQESSRLARHIQQELVAHLRSRFPGVDSLGVKQGPFLVLDGTHMPSVLVEIGFLTHEVEGQRLASAAYRESVAEGLYRGLKGYLGDEHARAEQR